MAKKKSFTSKRQTVQAANVDLKIGNDLINQSVVELASKITILKELKSYIRPLQESEFQLLKEDIEANGGCRDRLTVWVNPKGQYVLIDGHHRFRICTEGRELKDYLYFDVQEMEFSSIDSIKDWMDEMQMGRRNLTKQEVYYIRGRKYNRIKGTRGGNASEMTNTSEDLAIKFKVSERTVKRNGMFALGMDRLSGELREQILLGELPIRTPEIEWFGQHDQVSEGQFLEWIERGLSIEQMKAALLSKSQNKQKSKTTDQKPWEKFIQSSEKKVDQLIKNNDTEAMTSLLSFYEEQTQKLQSYIVKAK